MISFYSTVAALFIGSLIQEVCELSLDKDSHYTSQSMNTSCVSEPSDGTKSLCPFSKASAFPSTHHLGVRLVVLRREAPFQESGSYLTRELLRYRTTFLQGVTANGQRLDWQTKVLLRDKDAI